MDLSFKLYLTNSSVFEFRRMCLELEPYFHNYTVKIHTYDMQKDFDIVRYKNVPYNIFEKLPIKAKLCNINAESNYSEQTTPPHYFKAIFSGILSKSFDAKSSSCRGLIKTT